MGDAREGTNSNLRAQALARLGHQVDMLPTERVFGAQVASRWLGRLHYRTGFRLLQGRAVRALKELAAAGPKPCDIIWVSSGEWFGADSLCALRALGARLVLYVNDDPTGPRNPQRWRTFLGGVPEYDLIATVRETTASELRGLGARRVIRVWMSYDEVAHRPPTLSPDERSAWASEVSFVGTWMPERGPFLAELARRGIPLSIWGDHWPKALEWPVLKNHHRGAGLRPADYVRAIACAKVSLGILSKGNRDLHTRRSVEIPFVGGLLCAERTPEHQQLYQDGHDAMLWADPAECALRCATLLEDDVLREKIRLAGMARVRTLHLGNEDICRQVLNAVQSP